METQASVHVTQKQSAQVTSSSIDFIWLELTTKCNLWCSHCYAEASPYQPLHEKMEASDWHDVLFSAHSKGCKSVQFIGGEVLLIPYLETLVAAAREIGYVNIEVFTNATLVSDEIAAWMRRNQIKLATSFYSCDPQVHDKITARKGSWRKTVRGIERARDFGVIVRAGIIAMDSNRSEIAEVKKFLHDLGLSEVGIDHVRSFGRGVGQGRTTGYLSELCGKCGGGRLCVGASGDIFPCIMAKQTKLGNFLENRSLEDALSGNLLSAFREEVVAAKPDLSKIDVACTPGCWPNGGCAPHDMCVPDKKKDYSAACTPGCWPNGGCAPHDMCVPDKK